MLSLCYYHLLLFLKPLHMVFLYRDQPILQPAAYSDAVPDGSTDVSPAVPEGHAHPVFPRLSTQEMKIKAWTRLS